MRKEPKLKVDFSDVKKVFDELVKDQEALDSGEQRECTCEDWKENVDRLNEGALLLSTHGMGGYKGKYFVYCPWCSKRLIIKKAK